MILYYHKMEGLKMNLPKEYTEKMKRLFGEKEYQQYLDSFSEGKQAGLRINTLKWTKQEFLNKNIFDTQEVKWCQEGVYSQGEARPAKHPYYYAGLYYIQEPSAMAPAAVLPVDKGDYVLDICAAPGGKSTHLGAKLEQTGVLVANDISPSRTKALLKNIELFGITNSIVMSETPEKLSKSFPCYFDKILIDAPCSGEGMFRKEPDMIKSWNQKLIDFCIQQQRNILEHSATMLKNGGMLLYSTCTFSPEENEGMIQQFLEKHSEFFIVPLDYLLGFDRGRPEWLENAKEELKHCGRLFPHKIKGEGHFLALLQKRGEKRYDILEQEREDIDKRICFFHAFEKEILQKNWKKTEGIYKIYGDDLCYLPKGVPSLKGLRVLRSGLLLGTFKKNRFEPSQAFAMALTKKDVKNVIDFSLEEQSVVRYLKGETIEIPQQKEGWHLVCVDGYPLGWGKVQKGRLKNKYAVGWKWE